MTCQVVIATDWLPTVSRCARLCRRNFLVLRRPMPADWSQQEVAATVADYFAMLTLELRVESFSKREHNRTRATHADVVQRDRHHRRAARWSGAQLRRRSPLHHGLRHRAMAQ